MKAPVWGMTAAGATLGLLGGPMGVVIGVAVGGALDGLRYAHRRAYPLDEMHLRAVRLAAPGAADALIQQAASGSTPPQAALALQAFLEKHAPRRVSKAFWENASTRALVASFQTAYNADVETNQGLGPTPATGLFDAKTAAALTLYTHRSVSPDPSTAT